MALMNITADEFRLPAPSNQVMTSAVDADKTEGTVV